MSSAAAPLRRGAACAPGHAGGGEAVPRRALGGVRLGRPSRLQGFFSKGAARRRTGGPEDIRPPATTSRARPQGANGTPKAAPLGAAPQRVPEERWSRRLEASRSMRPGRENRGDATGRPTQKFFSGVPSSPSFEAGVRSGRTPGGIPRARDSRPSPSPVRACRLPRSEWLTANAAARSSARSAVPPCGASRRRRSGRQGPPG